MPEESPLQTLAPLHLVLEAEFVVFVRELEEIQHFRGSLHDREGRVGCVVDEHGDASVGVQTEEPWVQACRLSSCLISI